MAEATFLATIVASAPDYGLALVARANTTPGLGDLIIAHLPYNDYCYGAIPKPAFLSGANVMCWQNDSSSHLAYILGAANSEISKAVESPCGTLLYNVQKFLAWDSKAFEGMLNGLVIGVRDWFRSHSHGADSDMLPGDFDVIDKEGSAGAHIGRLIATLRGSPIAQLDISADTNSIRVLSMRTEEHTLLTERVADVDYSVSNRAMSLSEAFGLHSGPIMEEDSTGTTLQPVNHTALPLYRLQHIEGAVLGGEEALVLGFPPDTSVHDSSTEPPILARERTCIDGTLSKASAAAVISVKSPFIPGVHQLGYDQAPLAEIGDTFEDLRDPYDYVEGDEDTQEEPDASQEEQVDDAAINKLINTLLSEDYLKLVKAKLAEKGLTLASIDKSLYGQMDKPDEISGATAEPAYPLPQTITLVDPTTGEEKLYYASTSFISQEPDGSVLICDGYGSEIRMSRGNIYIGSALDTFIRPGRDLSAMVPRHQCFNSQGSCTINSSDALFIRAVNNLKIAGATGGVGVVTIESDSTQYKDVPGGLVLRSNSNVSLTGKDVYIGRNAHTSNAKSRVTEPETAGSVIIDAGSNGTIVERSLSHTIDSSEAIVGSLQGYNNSAIVVTQGTIGIYSTQVQMPASLYLQNLGGTVPISVFRDGEIAEVSLSTASTCDLVVNGSVLVNRDIVCNSSMKISVSLLARTIGSTNMFNAVVKEPDTTFKTTDLPNQNAPQSFGRNAASMVQAASYSLYQDYYVVGNCFAFPRSYGISSTLRVPGLVWQVRSIKYDTSSGEVWEEQYVKDAENQETACYPGFNVWEEATISVGDYETKKLKDSYVINTERMPVQ